MEDLNNKILDWQEKYNINSQTFRNDLLSFLVFNDWFGESPIIKGDHVYVPEDFLNNDKLHIFLSMQNKTSSEKTRELFRMLQKEFPETYQHFDWFKNRMKIDEKTVYSLLDFMLYDLPGELAFSTDKEIETLLEDAYDHLKKKDAETLVSFINWISQSPNIRTAYYNVYTINDYTSRKKQSEAYSPNFYLRILYYMFNAEYINENDMYKKAAKSKDYIDAWLFISLHFVCALRVSDLQRFPHPKLPSDPELILEQIANNTFSVIDAKFVLYSLTVYLDSVQLTPNKTKSYSGVSSIKFHIPVSLEEHFGRLFAIAEAHFQLQQKDPKEPLIVPIREYRDIKRAMGDEIGRLFLTSNFHCRQANKSFLQMIEIMTSSVLEEHQEFNVKGYFLAALARSHKGSYGKFAHTTSIYLKDQKMGGYSPEMVAREMMERGVLSNISSMLLKMVTDGEYEKLSVQEQTSIIQKLDMSPLEIENIVGLMQESTNRAKKTAILIYQTAGKEEVIDILHRLGNDNAVSKTDGCLCLKTAMKQFCPYPDRSSCIGCGYEVSTRTTCLQMADQLMQLQKHFKETSNQNEKNKAKAIASKLIAPKLTETLDCIKANYGEEEMKCIERMISEAAR